MAISANNKRITEVEEKLNRLLVNNFTSDELEIIRDFSAHWNIFDDALDGATKKEEEKCDHCGELMSEHDDGSCPLKVRED